MHSRFISGRRVHLREVRPADVNAAYYQWMNDPEVTRYLESRFYPQSLEGLREYVAGKLGDTHTIFLAIVLNEGERHIGNTTLGPIDWIHRTGDVGLLLGEKDCWGMGLAAEAIALLSDYAFGTLNLRKLTASCYAGNEGSSRAFEKAGFTVEGVRRGHFFSEGTYVDQILLGRIRGEESTG